MNYVVFLDHSSSTLTFLKVKRKQICYCHIIEDKKYNVVLLSDAVKTFRSLDTFCNPVLPLNGIVAAFLNYRNYCHMMKY